jgi:hypothetical protein
MVKQAIDSGHLDIQSTVLGPVVAATVTLGSFLEMQSLEPNPSTTESESIFLNKENGSSVLWSYVYENAKKHLASTLGSYFLPFK